LVGDRHILWWSVKSKDAVSISSVMSYPNQSSDGNFKTQGKKKPLVELFSRRGWLSYSRISPFDIPHSGFFLNRGLHLLPHQCFPKFTRA